MSRIHRTQRLCFALLLALGLFSSLASAATVDFEDLTLAPNAFESGSNLSGSFNSGGVKFFNNYPGYWAHGFVYSNTNNTTQGDYLNGQSAFTGTGAGAGADNYAVATGYLDLQMNNIQLFDFDPNNTAHLNQLPSFELPANFRAQSVLVTNSTYSAIVMRDGNMFSRKFGGVSGNDPDFFKLTAYGTNAAGVPLGIGVEFYLADFRNPNNASDYILNQWTMMDLSALSDAKRIYFNLSSTDFGVDGMNTPAYFAIDNLQITPVPEPTTYVGLLLTACGVLYMKRRHRLIA